MELLFDELALIFYKCGTEYGDIPKYGTKYAMEKIIWKLIPNKHCRKWINHVDTYICYTRVCKKSQTLNYQILIFFFFSCFYTLSEFLKLLRKWDFVNNFCFSFNSTFAKFTDLETLLYISPWWEEFVDSSFHTLIYLNCYHILAVVFKDALKFCIKFMQVYC